MRDLQRGGVNDRPHLAGGAGRPTISVTDATKPTAESAATVSSPGSVTAGVLIVSASAGIDPPQTAITFGSDGISIAGVIEPHELPAHSVRIDMPTDRCVVAGLVAATYDLPL